MPLKDQVIPRSMDSPDISAPADTEKINRIRSLVLGNDYEEAIKTFITESDTERVSKVISEALRERASKDQSLSSVLSPIIDSAINESIKQNPKRITNVIFPVMGPAIRKAVSAALSDMVQTLNQMLSNSLSVRSWGWRYQAWRSGKNYGEFVLLKALKYRVEQVFLIHKNTGLLLNDVSTSGLQKQDPELVSSMLSAINDFVADSFHKPEKLSIDSVRFGEYNLIIVPGPLAVIAAAIKGTPSEEINEQLRVAIEKIHGDHLAQLIDFEGDKDDFLSTEPILKGCLLQKTIERQKSKPWLAYTLIGLIIALGTWQAYTGYAKATLKDHIITTIKQQPGYLVVDQSIDGNQLNMVLLRPPESSEPDTVLSSLDTGDWDVQIKDKIAPLNISQYILPFIRETFALSSDVGLSMSDNNTLIVSGVLPENAFLSMQKSQLINTTFSNVNFDNASITPQLSAYEKNVRAWHSIISSITTTKVYFEENSDNLLKGEMMKITRLAHQIHELNYLATQIHVPEFQVLITGFADARGSKLGNIKVSEARANKINRLLLSKNIDSRLLVNWGAGHIDSSKLSAQEQRIASFQVLHPELKP